MIFEPIVDVSTMVRSCYQELGSRHPFSLLNKNSIQEEDRFNHDLLEDLCIMGKTFLENCLEWAEGRSIWYPMDYFLYGINR
jgi:hypothetical protein